MTVGHALQDVSEPDVAFIETLSGLLGHALGRSQAMADHDAPGIVPEAPSMQ
jgi:hypothetical protein